MTLALLITAATGAWAESKPIGLNVEYKAGDEITSTTDVYVYYGEELNTYNKMGVKITSTQPLKIFMITAHGFELNGDAEVYYLPSGESKGGYAGGIPCVGESTGDATVVHVASGSGTLADPYVFGSGPFGTPVPITWSAATPNTATIASMPAGNVIVTPEYYPQATLTAAPTAINDVPATTDRAIVKAGTVANIGSTETKQGTVMYYVSTTAMTDDQLLALAADAWTADVPTAESLAQGQAYVYYYVRGNDSDTDDENFSDSDIKAANKLTVTIAAAPITLTLATNDSEMGTVTLVAGAGSSAQDGDNLIATNANLEGANTSRNIAVGDDGTIHVVYKHAESGAVMYMKSTDGVTFSEPVQVSAESGDECEVAVSSNGKVYVSYVANSLGYIAYSADGSSFTSVQVSSGDFYSIHLAGDGGYVYGIPRFGTEFYYSADGGQNYATHTGWTGYAFSDVLIDKSNNNVVVIKDMPDVVVRYSTDHGATFTEEQPVMNGTAQLAVLYSTAAAGAGKVFISGADGMIATVDYINATCTLTTIESTNNRSLCADEDENVIVGVEKDGSLYYELSTDGAQTFGEKVLVSEGSSANAALNHHDGSLLYLFTKGTDLYLATKTGVVSTETVIDNGDGTYSVVPGTEVTIKATANEGYHVASWSNSVEVNDPQEATQTLTVTGELNITATFGENEYNITFAEGTNDDNKWTATPNPAKTKATVTVTYTGTRKVIGVKAEKTKLPKLSDAFVDGNETVITFGELLSFSATYNNGAFGTVTQSGNLDNNFTTSMEKSGNNLVITSSDTGFGGATMTIDTVNNTYTVDGWINVFCVLSAITIGGNSIPLPTKQ